MVVTKARHLAANKGIRGVGFGNSNKTSQELLTAIRLSRRGKRTYRIKYSAMTRMHETTHRNSQADLSPSVEVLARRAM
jgi:hypothetical protein